MYCTIQKFPTSNKFVTNVKFSAPTLFPPCYSATPTQESLVGGLSDESKAEAAQEATISPSCYISTITVHVV